MNNLSLAGWTAFDECDKRVCVTQTQSLPPMRSTMRMLVLWIYSLEVRVCDEAKFLLISVLKE